jgi:hypothetical protein
MPKILPPRNPKGMYSDFHWPQELAYQHHHGLGDNHNITDDTPNFPILASASLEVLNILQSSCNICRYCHCQFSYKLPVLKPNETLLFIDQPLRIKQKIRPFTYCLMRTMTIQVGLINLPTYINSSLDSLSDKSFSPFPDQLIACFFYYLPHISTMSMGLLLVPLPPFLTKQHTVRGSSQSGSLTLLDCPSWLCHLLAGEP